MLTVDDYTRIRIAHRDGMSIRAIARTFEHSRRKVREILANAQPAGYARAKPKPAPVLGSFHAVIDSVLAGDENAPPKQRHTAMQLYRRLRDEYRYGGSYDQVRRYVATHRRDRRETYIPLAHDPGQRLALRLLSFIPFGLHFLFVWVPLMKAQERTIIAETPFA